MKPEQYRKAQEIQIKISNIEGKSDSMIASVSDWIKHLPDFEKELSDRILIIQGKANSEIEYLQKQFYAL